MQKKMSNRVLEHCAKLWTFGFLVEYWAEAHGGLGGRCYALLSVLWLDQNVLASAEATSRLMPQAGRRRACFRHAWSRGKVLDR